MAIKRTIMAMVMLCVAGALVAEESWEAAERNGEQARKAFLGCWRFVEGWLQHADPVSGLIPRNLTKDFYWNARDAAADNYPFMVMSAFFTDRDLFDGRMHAMLAAEQRLCNRVGRLPDDYLFATQSFRTAAPVMDDLIFGASEYAKDGLLPLTELLGPSPWSDRMLDLLDDIWKQATIDTEVGKLPSTSHEVCGELMQTLSRMYWMTSNDNYRVWAYRLADYFLVHHPPVEERRLRLDDHGCEVLGGLSEVYYLAAQKDPEKQAAWKAEMHRTLDRVLEVGRDENGLLWNTVDPRRGRVLSEDKTDNWGYNYNAFLVVADLDNVPRYREAVEFVLTHLPANKDYPWEGDIADGIADSLEGGLNLLNRIPVGPAIAWADYMGGRLLAKQRDTGVVAGWHGDGNFARTALMYALWKTQGAYVHPWRADLRLGAVRAEDGSVYFSITAEWPWHGKLHFDVPRHAEWLHLPSDYARLNQFPEWFTVAQAGTFETDRGEQTAAALRAGLDVSVSPEQPCRIRMKAAP